MKEGAEVLNKHNKSEVVLVYLIRWIYALSDHMKDRSTSGTPV